MKEFPPLVEIIFMLVSEGGQRAEHSEKGRRHRRRRRRLPNASRRRSSTAQTHLARVCSPPCLMSVCSGSAAQAGRLINISCRTAAFLHFAWRKSSMTLLMSAVGEPWTQISLHAVKSDPHHKPTPLPLVRYPRLKYRRLACHFLLTQQEQLSRRGSR